MHPALLETGPGTTMDISFSLRQDPLEQALFGEKVLWTFFAPLFFRKILSVSLWKIFLRKLPPVLV